MNRDDLILDGIGLELYRPGSGKGRAVSSTAIPALASETLQLADEPLVLDTFHLGFGYSQRLLPGTYAYGDNVDARWPRVVLPGPQLNSVTLTGSTDHARCAMEVGGHLYVGAGRYVYKIASGTGSPAQDRDLGASRVAWSAVTFKGDGYVGKTNAGSIAPLEKLAASGLTWSTSADVSAKHLATVFWDTDYRLIAQRSSSAISHVAADPMSDADHSADITIGDSGYEINRLVTHNDHVYVAKRNGLHDLDGTTSRSPNLTPQVAHVDDSSNGLAALSANGAIYFAHRKGLLRVHVSGLMEEGRIYNVQPGHGLPNETPIRGIVTALAAEGGWIAAAVWNGTDTYICWGRERHGDEPGIGPSPMLWHGGLIKLSALECHLLHISALTSPPRLWIGAGSSGAGYNLRYCILPRTEHPLQDSEYRYAESFSLYLAGQDWNWITTRKNLLQIDVEADGLGSGGLAVYTNVEGGAYGLFGTAATSPQSTLLPTDEVIGRRIGFRWDGTSSDTTPVAVRGFLARAAARVATREIRTYHVLLAEYQGDRFRGRGGMDPANVWDRLKAMEVGSQVTLRDELGDTLDVLIHAPVERQEIEQIESGTGAGKSARPIQVVKLTVSILGRLGTGFRWGQGSWGSGVVYGGAV